jgi:predicted ATPase/DNA-binding winged helix-turn-helix (wHTH) protein
VILKFADCELDLGRVVLRRDGRDVKVEPQVFDVLALLAQRRGEVVRKEELLDEIWGDRFVSESTLTTRIKTVRQAIGDDGSRQSIIRTVHGKGYEFIAQVEVVEAARTDPAAATGAASAASGLPVAVQPLIGRELLLALLVDAVATHRLVTLVGPGGVGKTSLGFELARNVAGRYADGVSVVELVSVVDEDATVAAFATAIDVNLRRQSSIDDAILATLRPRQCLLLLDNCEHLVEPVAALVSRILRDAPSVSIVATSREPLAVPAEHVWSVAPLSTAAENAGGPDVTRIPAVELFVERARAADPAFVLDADTAPLVVEICRRLDGIPLAIELAAARTRATDVAEIARRLDERFGLLKAMRRGSDPRHRTMHDAVSWSYDLLAPDEQELFTGLSVFAGSFDLAAAEAMCTTGDALDVLTRLTERSMVSVRRSGGGTRYELLETLRAYGRTRLGDTRAVELFAAHANYFAAEAVAVEHALRGPSEAAAMAGAEASFADLRAAQRFAVESGALDAAFGLIGSLREFAMRAMRYEVFVWAAAACRAPGSADHPLLPLLTGICAYGAWVRGEFDVAVALAEEARRLETTFGVAPSGLAERVLANVLCLIDQIDAAYGEAQRQLEVAEDAGIPSRIVHALYMGSIAHSSTGDYETAAEYVARAHQLALATESPTDLASAYVAEGFAESGDDALSAFTESDRLATSAGNRWMSAFARTEASGLLVHRGEIARGCAGLAEMVSRWYQAGEWAQQWHTLTRCVIALHRIDRSALAAEVVGAIDEHAKLGGAPMTPTLRDVAFVTRDALVDELGEEQFAALRAAGAACPVEDIVHRTHNALLGRPLAH